MSVRPQRELLVIFTLFILVILGFYLFSYLQPVVESPRTELKYIPTDVAKKITPFPRVTHIRVPILMYHYVEYVKDKGDTIRQSLNVNPAIFEQQLITLVDAGYIFMTAKDLANVLDGAADLPEKPIVMTFDDGHRDFYTDVFPLLKKYHVHATQYVISGFIEGSDFMTAAQLREISQNRLIEIGAHTVHHRGLRGDLQAVVREEVTGSKQALENMLNIKVYSFAYPNGFFDGQAIEEVKKAGYTNAVSTIPGEDQSPENRYYLSRLRVGHRTGKELLDYIQSNPWTLPLSRPTLRK